jgi:hypothetical protein
VLTVAGNLVAGEESAGGRPSSVPPPCSGAGLNRPRAEPCAGPSWLIGPARSRVGFCFQFIYLILMQTSKMYISCSRGPNEML